MDEVYFVVDGRSRRARHPRRTRRPLGDVSPDRACARKPNEPTPRRRHRRPCAPTRRCSSASTADRLARMLSSTRWRPSWRLIPAYIIGEITNFAATHQLTSQRITVYVERALRVVDPLRRALVPRATTQLRPGRDRLRAAARGVPRERARLSRWSRSNAPVPVTSSVVRPTTSRRSRARCASPCPSGSSPSSRPCSRSSRWSLVSPLAAVASLVSMPILFFSTRYYLHYATPGLPCASASVTPRCPARCPRRPRAPAPSTRTDSVLARSDASTATCASPSTPRCTRC